MDDTTILGGVLNQLGQTAKQTVKQAVKLPQELAKDTGEQIGGSASAKQNPAEEKGLNGKQQWQSDEERVRFLRDLYGSAKPDTVQNLAKQNPSEVKKDDSQAATQNKKPSEFQEQIADKSPEEQKELMALRNQLHREVYYDPTFNPVKKQEERPAEKVENEKKQEMAELQQKDAKKPPPLAVIREQNKAEMFRGAAG